MAVINGTEATDFLSGTDDADTINGFGGDDWIGPGAGADTIDGGDGRDMLLYGNSSAGISINLATGVASGGDAEGDTFTDIEDVWGSTHDDTLVGDSNSNWLFGHKGNDLLDGGAGGDLLDGYDGDDTLNGGDGDDGLDGGAGADTLNGGAGVDVLLYVGSDAGVSINLATGTASGGDAAGDTFSGMEQIWGSDFGDTLVGDAAANELLGWAGDDLLEGGAGADVLDGGDGQDFLEYLHSSAGVSVNLETGAASGGEAEGDTIAGMEGLGGSEFNDTLVGNAAANHIRGRHGDDLIEGGAGDDTLVGQGSNDTLHGGDGDDRLFVEGGVDVLDGGAGEDVADASLSNAGVSINLATGVGSGGGAEGDTFDGIEDVDGSAFGDTITGDSGFNFLFGAAGDDTLSGEDGDDVLRGGAGADVLDGGAGEDALEYWDSSAGVSINLATGAASGGDAEGDTLAGLENIAGSAHNDVLIGDAGANALFGLAGDDRIDGGEGDDLLGGGGGNDAIAGGAGADMNHGGDGLDYVDYRFSPGGVSVDLATGTASGGDAEGDTFDRIESIGGSNHADVVVGDAADNRLDGRDGDDRLVGGAGADFLLGDDSPNPTGFAGNDTLDGGDGNDRLAGAAGADTLIGGAGVDQADYYNSSAGVLVDLFFGGASGGDAEGDTFDGIENASGSAHNDTLIGNSAANQLVGAAGDDILTGDTGNDDLQGGDGNDMLDGGFGNDTLNGGAGADRFSFTTVLSATNNVDTVADFAVADDVIQIDDAVFSGGGLEAGTLAANQFVIGSAAMDANDRIIYDSATGGSFYDADGTGGGAQVQFATVDTGLAMTNNDFLVI